MPKRNKGHKTSGTREVVDPAPPDGAGEAEQLVDAAQGYLCEAETRITEGSNGGRGIALLGIGSALCSIARSLSTIGEVAEMDCGRPERVDAALEELLQAPDCFEGEVVPFAKVGQLRRHVRIAICMLSGCTEQEIEALREGAAIERDAGGHEWDRGECRRCGIAIGKALPRCAVRDLDERAARMPAGFVEVEIAVAVVCIDCQAEHNHEAGDCGRAGECAVCGRPSGLPVAPGTCRCCDGELVLDEPIVAAFTCAADTAHWCSYHCPIDHAPNGPCADINCGASGNVCLQHCGGAK
ncbi:hypothetical protein LCGC14_1116740 [marine sediment metagenome]|uniref:Uncharacterized protein n=1 Tax=marine sediment metagenome TaxID=412755 RepID=A0A0F9QAY3_9ZZZZ